MEFGIPNGEACFDFHFWIVFTENLNTQRIVTSTVFVSSELQRQSDTPWKAHV
jgi:hypothetical protein